MAILTSLWETANTTLALLKTYLGEDDKTNKEPIHDAQTDIDAVTWNEFVSAHAELGLRMRPGNLLCLTWHRANLAASLTDDPLERVMNSDAAGTLWTPYRGGQIVGMGIRLENAATAGGATAVTVEARINSTKATELTGAVIDSTGGAPGDQKARATRLPTNAVNGTPGNATFAALDDVDVVVTTDAAFAAGATPSLFVDLFISIGGEDEAL